MSVPPKFKFSLCALSSRTIFVLSHDVEDLAGRPAGTHRVLSDAAGAKTRQIGRPAFRLDDELFPFTIDGLGLSHVRIQKNFVILDVGCGGGRTIQKLAVQASEGKIFGVDYASGSIAASRAKNADLIRADRVDIRHASVSRLPFPDDTFHVVTAIETQYYWPNLPADMREILRVLQPGGTLAVILETYRKGVRNALLTPAMRLLGAATLSVAEQRALFSEAGYVNVQVIEEPRKGWLCVIGTKPELTGSTLTSSGIWTRPRHEFSDKPANSTMQPSTAHSNSRLRKG